MHFYVLCTLLYAVYQHILNQKQVLLLPARPLAIPLRPGPLTRLFYAQETQIGQNVTDTGQGSTCLPDETLGVGSGFTIHLSPNETAFI